MTRLQPDPIPDPPGILTAGQLAACVRVLQALRTRVNASLTLTFSPDDQRAYACLARNGYVRTVRARGGSQFRWDEIEATEAGLAWLAQVATP